MDLHSRAPRIHQILPRLEPPILRPLVLPVLSGSLIAAVLHKRVALGRVPASLRIRWDRLLQLLHTDNRSQQLLLVAALIWGHHNNHDVEESSEPSVHASNKK